MLVAVARNGIRSSAVGAGGYCAPHSPSRRALAIDESDARSRSLHAGLRSWAPGCRARKGAAMGQPVVHFEVIWKDPAGLQGYYGEMFGWEFDTSSPVSDAVSEPTNYGFVERNTTSDGTGIPGGVGGGTGYA